MNDHQRGKRNTFGFGHGDDDDEIGDDEISQLGPAGYLCEDGYYCEILFFYGCRGSVQKCDPVFFCTVRS